MTIRYLDYNISLKIFVFILVEKSWNFFEQNIIFLVKKSWIMSFKMIASGSFDKSIKLWNDDGELIIEK